MHGAALFFVVLAFAPQGKSKNVIPEKPPTKVYLKSGSSFEGKVLSEDEKTIRLAVSFGEIILRKEEVSRVHRGEELSVLDANPVSIAIGENAEPTKVPKGFKLPPPLPPEERVQRAATPAAGSTTPSRPPLTLDRQLEGVLGHYFWFFPQAGNAKYLMGAGFFLAFLAVFFLACKLTGIEDLSLGRALAFCGIFFVVLSVQVHFDPSDLGQIALFGAVDLALWFGLVKWILREPLYRGGGVLAFFVFASLLGVLGSEIGYVLTRQS